MKIRIKTNLCTGIIMGAASIWLLFLLPREVRLPAYDSGAPSPRIIPMLALSGILLSSVCLLIQSLILKKEKIYEFELKRELPTVILIGMMCLFTLLTIKLGFIVAVCIVFPMLLFYFGERKPFIYIFSLAAGIGIYFLFKNVFHISLPHFPGFGG